jgi:hypothetical protein
MSGTEQSIRLTVASCVARHVGYRLLNLPNFVDDMRILVGSSLVVFLGNVLVVGGRLADARGSRSVEGLIEGITL